ncbi:cobalamin biosynthesis protein [Metapseudomonas boanensis]|uniref:Cobalamin biosynthesis protein n=1 Tax=Metapseudomonas boanensis TaxID=2822138 RepID=A0ABS5XJZ8_9GAMM|nr:cobalamin biosynthesis protein [Pseudomonas boanensis]MBT8768001.1 cobalamin biosynthesis protein [Pseudomonas boanensis]
MRLVAGLGCRRGCSAEELRGLLMQCLAEADRPLSTLVALASSEHKAGEPGLHDLAQQLGLPLHCLPSARLAAYDGQLQQASDLVLRTTGSAGVAEAAALAQAFALSDGSAELLIEKRCSASATCALACIDDEAQQP